MLHLIGSTGLYGAERWILALMRTAPATRFKSILANLVDTKGYGSAVVQAAHQRGLAALDFYTGGTFNPLTIFQLAHWVRQRNIRIIHSHGYKSDLIGLVVARLTRCKILATPHGWSLEKDKKLQFYEKLDRVLFNFMDRICPLSPELESGIRKGTSTALVKLIYNGVDIDEIRTAPPFPITDSGEYVIGYIGQLIERKNLGTLLAAVKMIVGKRPNMRLMVIGDGPERSYLQNEAARLGISSQVRFLGFRTDAVRYLKTFDAFVLPSLMEGIPRCIMEAMAAGIPVVVSDIAGNRALVAHGKTGRIFAPGDSRDLADQLDYLIEHPDEATTMAIHGMKRIEQSYSSRKMAKEYHTLYQELIGMG